MFDLVTVKPIHFKTRLVSPQKGWTFIYVPNDLLGTTRRVWLKGKINGKPFYLTANPWRDDTHIITVNKQVRSRLGLSENDKVDMEFVVVTSPPPEPPIPDDLKKALKANPKAMSEFTRIPPSHRKEYISYINEAKKPETRASRIEKTIKRLANIGKS